MSRLLCKVFMMVFAAVALAACDTINVYPSAPQVQTDTLQKVILPPFGLYPNFQAEPNNAEYQVSISFFVPANFQAVFTTESSNTAVATVEPNPKCNLDADPMMSGRIICTVFVNFRVLSIGKSIITLTLVNAGNQKTSFSIEGVTQLTKG